MTRSKKYFTKNYSSLTDLRFQLSYKTNKKKHYSLCVIEPWVSAGKTISNNSEQLQYLLYLVVSLKVPSCVIA